MSAPIRIGVVGTGSLGYHHARILRDVQGVAFRGFFEANAERAGTVQRELGVRAYETLDALLDDVDAVSVVVPTSRHHQVAMAALAKGKHLLIEKPITVTLGEADELLALAEQKRLHVQIGARKMQGGREQTDRNEQRRRGQRAGGVHHRLPALTRGPGSRWWA